MRRRGRRSRRQLSLVQYLLISLGVFFAAVLIAWLTSGLMEDLVRSDQRIGYMVGMLEGIIGAIAAGLVLYQLAVDRRVRERQNDIDEGDFLLEYNQAFIQDANMAEVEYLLEQKMFYGRTGSIITEGNRQKFINYLVYLEGMAPLILNGVLKLEHIDDLMAYRYFLAVNCPELQRDQLFPYAEYYRGCFKVYKKWRVYRKRHHRELLADKTGLHKWSDYDKYANG